MQADMDGAKKQRQGDLSLLGAKHRFSEGIARRENRMGRLRRRTQPCCFTARLKRVGDLGNDKAQPSFCGVCRILVRRKAQSNISLLFESFKANIKVIILISYSRFLNTFLNTFLRG